MAYKKGEKVETGIWHLADSKLYLAEVNYTNPSTGHRDRKRKTTHRLDLARDWRKTQAADALRKDIRREKRQRAIPFKTFSAEYLEKWSRLEKKPSSYKRDGYSVDRLKEYFGRKSITVISRKDVERYVAHRRQTVSKATTNRELCCLKNMLRKAVDWEYLTINPAWGVKQAKEEPKEFDYLTLDEVDRLLESCLPHLKTFLILAIYTGLRKGELFGLEWRDVDLTKDNRGMITVRDTKNHETRYIPMNKKVRQAIENHPKRIVDGKVCDAIFCNEKGRPLKDPRTAFRTSLDDAGIERQVRVHDLRHTFASHLVMKGVDMRSVAKLMGHKDIKVTMRYSHLAPEHLQAAVDSLETREQKGRKQA